MLNTSNLPQKTASYNSIVYSHHGLIVSNLNNTIDYNFYLISDLFLVDATLYNVQSSIYKLSCSIRLSNVLKIGIILVFFNSPLYDVLNYSSTTSALSEIGNNNPDGGILLHSSKLSIPTLLYYDRCSTLNNFSLIVLFALFILSYVSSSYTHILPSNPCLINL